MKKITLLLLITLSSYFSFSQAYCQSAFTFSTSPMLGVNFYDQSYNIDSNLQIEVISWQWTFNGNGMQLTSTEQNPTAVQLSNGVYNVCLSIETSDGCTSTYCENVTIGNPCNLVVTGTITNDDGSCNGQVSLSVSGGTPPYFYTWNNNINAPHIATLLCAGTYSVTVSDQSGCYGSGVFTVMNSNINQNCNALFSYSGTPGGVYQFTSLSTANSPIAAYYWTFGNGTPSTSTLANPTVSYANVMSSLVCLTITTDSGYTCTHCDSIVMNGNTPCDFVVDADVSPVSYVGGNDGSIDLIVNGGTPPFSFAWSNNSTTEDQTGLTSGVYTVQVYDNNCSQGQFYTFSLYEPNDTTNGNYILDTLFTTIDTCLGFTPNSYYVNNVQIIDENTVLVTWTFTNNGMLETLVVEYEYTTNGNNQIVLTLNCEGNKMMSTFFSYIHINQVNEILDSKHASFELYPNPTSNDFTIKATPPYLLTITDVKGKTIWKQQINESVFSAPVDMFTNGIYFVRVNGTNSVSTQKLIIFK